MSGYYQITFPGPSPVKQDIITKIFGASVAICPNSYVVHMHDTGWEQPGKTLKALWPGALPDFLATTIIPSFCTNKALQNEIESLEEIAEKNLLLRVEDLTQEVRELQQELATYKKPPSVILFDSLQLSSVYKELESLLGLQDAKSLIQELDANRKMQLLMNAAGIETYEMASNHLLATGGPGTGKTTFARLYAKALKALGVLSKGHLIETDRSGLVGAYVGHTEMQTDEVLNAAEGGVLFIDEAYSLYSDSGNDFGSIALAQIVKRMEDRRNDLVIIMAGYPGEMKKFIEMNSGLKSRFSHTLYFPDFSNEDLLKIAHDILARKVLTPCERFAISAQNKAQASRVIKEATGSGLILPYDENAPPKLMKYIPFWAHLVDGQALA